MVIKKLRSTVRPLKDLNQNSKDSELVSKTQNVTVSSESPYRCSIVTEAVSGPCVRVTVSESSYPSMICQAVFPERPPLSVPDPLSVPETRPDAVFILPGPARGRRGPNTFCPLSKRRRDPAQEGMKGEWGGRKGEGSS